MRIVFASLLLAFTALAQQVATHYTGNSTLAGMLRTNHVQPLALASADFDEDGVADLASGYRIAGGAGILTIHRGNVDALWPYRAAIRNGGPSPFLSEARVFALPEAPDFLATGDFNADGHQDIVAAHRGSSALYYMLGDGRGGFGDPQRIELPGTVTALATGDLNRRDGLTDVAAGIAGEHGFEALVFESPGGAMRAEAESFALPAAANAFAVLDFDGDRTNDLAIAAGRELVVVYGRDRKLTLEKAEREKAPSARISRHNFAFGLRGMAVGAFSSRRTNLALLGDDGKVHVFEVAGAPARQGIIQVPGQPPSVANLVEDPPEETASTAGQLVLRDEISLPASAGAQDGVGEQLIAARVSALGRESLVVLDRGRNQVHVLGRGSVDIAGAPAAVLPMRLSPQPLSELVVLHSGQAEPAVTTSASPTVFTVTNTNDSGPGSLRSAILNANVTVGAASIVFNIPNTDPNRDSKTGVFTIKPLSESPGSTLDLDALPALLHIMTIDGYTQPGASPNTLSNGDNAVILIHIDGALAGQGASGFRTTQDGGTIRGLSITGFTKPYFDGKFNHGATGFELDGATGFIEGNFIGLGANGTDAGGNNTGISDFGYGFDLPGWMIGGLVPQARNVVSANSGAGIAFANVSVGGAAVGNFVGTDITGTVAKLNGTGVLSNGAATIGGTVAGSQNLISGNGLNVDFNDISGSGLANNNLVQGNLIGTDVTGTKVLTGAGTGVTIEVSAKNTLVGGTTPAARNIISGNYDGIAIFDSAAGNVIQGNFIGLDVTGTKAVGNADDGIFAGNSGSPKQGPAQNTTVGGAVAGAANVISGNTKNGIEFNSSTGQPGNIVQGNFIGTDPMGTTAFGNQSNGISLVSGTNTNLIGGTDTLARNVIAFNANDGVHIDVGNTNSNSVTGNSIFSNGGAGVHMVTGTGTRIQRNSIYSNAKLGIDLDPVGPNAISSCNSSTNGPNGLQNAPTLMTGTGATLISATATDSANNTSEFSNCAATTLSGNNLTLLGTLQGKAGATYTLEFFQNNSCDASGFGQGKTFLGATTITTNGSCSAAINTTVDISKADLAVALNLDMDFFVGLAAPSIYTATITNNGAHSASNVMLTDAVPSILSISSVTTTQGSCATSGNNVTCSLGTMPAGATGSVAITVVPMATGTASNTVNVTATEPDPNAANNSANVTSQSVNDAPAINSFHPFSAIANGQNTQLVIVGSSFLTSSVVSFKGTTLAATLLSNQPCNIQGIPTTCQGLQVTIPGSLLMSGGNATVSVTNPTPGGGTASMMFPIAASCSFTVSPTTPQNLSSDNQGLSIMVTTNDQNCPWTYSASDSWLFITSSFPYSSGNGGAFYSVRKNPGAARTGTVTVAGTTITVNQAGGAACNYAFNSISENVPMAGGSGSVGLITSGSCPWTPASNAAWITITSVISAKGLGNGTINYSVASNSGPPRSGTITVADQTYTVNQAGTGTAPTLSLSRNSLNYGYSGTLITSMQPILVNFTGGTGVAWTASSNQSNITVSPTSGNGNGQLMITVNPGPAGIVTVTAPGAIGSPQQVQINVASVTPGLPFGSFDTPLNNTTGIAGAIPVTGWALDNIEVTKVDIWREPVNSEPAGNLVYIGDAVFVIGARPDVEAANPTAPWNYRAGWGYLMLTNFLPNVPGPGYGNGTYKLHAIAHNKSGSQTDLGTRTITVDNVHASKPFGTVDTPGQGGSASGAAFINFGWALTQNPYMIPNDGSTITVYVDSMPLGHPTYNQFRSDVATLFPGLANSNGAIGYFSLDTTKYNNGVHTIFWIAFDSAMRGDGLGSRYFNVLNVGTGAAVQPQPPAAIDKEVKLRQGFGAGRSLARRGGVYRIEIEELERMELDVSASGGYELVDNQRRALPIGSTLQRGTFYWQPGPGFLGDYELVFLRPDGGKVPVRVSIHAKSY